MDPEKTLKRTIYINICKVFFQIWLHKLHSHRIKKKDHKNKNCTTIRTKTIFPHASARGRGKNQKEHRKKTKKNNNNKKNNISRLSGRGGSQPRLSEYCFFFVFFVSMFFFGFCHPPLQRVRKDCFVLLVRCGGAVFN